MIPFYCTPVYIKVSGVWKPCLPFLKNISMIPDWVPVHTQGNVSGGWKP